MKRGDLESRAYSELKSAIVTLVYPPGAQVVEDVVAKQLNMSRSPVRIAIKRLQAEGFLEQRSNKRIYVALINNKRTLDALYIREALEGMSARLAAKNATDEDKIHLKSMLSDMEELLQQNNIYELYRMGFDLHKKIFYISKNDQLARIGINTLEQESVFSYHSLHQSLTRAVNAHQEHIIIADHIIKGEKDAAEEAARKHVHHVIDRFKEISIPEPPPQTLLLP